MTQIRCLHLETNKNNYILTFKTAKTTFYKLFIAKRKLMITVNFCCLRNKQTNLKNASRLLKTKQNMQKDLGYINASLPPPPPSPTARPRLVSPYTDVESATGLPGMKKYTVRVFLSAGGFVFCFGICVACLCANQSFSGRKHTHTHTHTHTRFPTIKNQTILLYFFVHLIKNGCCHVVVFYVILNVL